MTGAELKEALMDGRRVEHNGIEYERVEGIIYRNRDGKIVISAELIDKGNCLVIAAANKINNVGDKNGQGV